MSDSSVLVILVNWNGSGFIEDCIKSIENNTVLSDDRFEVVVVDNGSNDNSDDWVEEKGYEVIKNDRNLGFDIANNIAIHQNPDYNYYMLLNNDTEVKSGWLKHLVDFADETEDGGVFGPKILNTDLTIQSAGFEKPGENSFEGKERSSVSEVKEADIAHGSAMMISREVINSIGYLDELFTLGNAEEWDYCYRAKETGFSIYIVPDSEVIHKEDLTKDNTDSGLVYMLGVKNNLKHKIMNCKSQVILQALMNSVKMFGASIIGYKYNPMLPLLKAHLEVIMDLPDLLRKRRKSDRYIPSYYCEGIKDYSKRYQ
jgi:GT2 family glycosyltransferase